MGYTFYGPKALPCYYCDDRRTISMTVGTFYIRDSIFQTFFNENRLSDFKPDPQ